MAIKKDDFIKIEFTGSLSETGEVFDTNKESDKSEVGMDDKKAKPFIMAVGHKMLPAGLDADLIGKEIGTDYKIELMPEDAFGLRNKDMIQMIPTKRFHEQKIDPQRGMMLNLDGQLVKVLSSDRGRTLIDFNNPLAGKQVTYNYKILEEITDTKEKVNGLQDFLFRKRFDFEEKDGNIVFKVEANMEQFIGMFAEKFKEILGMEISAEVVETGTASANQGTEFNATDNAVVAEEKNDK